ncbi:hypothetical protein KIH77_02400 [Bifidobacterium sp. 82T24]|uniref:hypothetical protein n=1 Tax=Bifidobacterium pluvialisilvae TaxID=2834436 RepID=UPI001C5A3AF1|nr:hypothetical protein [Bifidobacterium pluvialisilvae]MBW3087592.1 hypothetical protein [Bifidobacterium pluvialisilvae]
MAFVAYILALLSIACDFVNPFVGVFGTLFKGIMLFFTSVALFNAWVRRNALADTRRGNYYQSLEAHGIMHERTGRMLSDAVLNSMIAMIRIGAVLFVACATLLNGFLCLMVVRYPKELSLAPFVSLGKGMGPLLLVAGFALSVAAAVLFWKMATRMRRVA